MTYSINGATASQLESTYLCACANSFLSSLVLLTFFLFPNRNFCCFFIPNGLPETSSSFLLGLLNLVSTPDRYCEQNVKHSLAKNPSAIDPSGWALLRTKDLRVRRNLKVKKI